MCAYAHEDYRTAEPSAGLKTKGLYDPRFFGWTD